MSIEPANDNEACRRPKLGTSRENVKISARFHDDNSFHTVRFAIVIFDVYVYFYQRPLSNKLQF